MAYNKQTWDATSFVNPTRMNHIENGIQENSDEVGVLKQNIDDLVSASEWKLVGTKTDKSDLELPTNWKELKFVFKIAASVYTKTYDRFSVDGGDIVAYVESYYYSATDNAIVNLNLSLSRVNIRNAKRNGEDYAVFELKVYYR